MRVLHATDMRNRGFNASYTSYHDNIESEHAHSAFAEPCDTNARLILAHTWKLLQNCKLVNNKPHTELTDAASNKLYACIESSLNIRENTDNLPQPQLALSGNRHISL